MQQEWDSIWTKTWQLVCREADLKYEGSFITHEIGKESFLIVKGNDGKIRAFLPQSGNLLYVINDAHNHGVTAVNGTADG